MKLTNADVKMLRAIEGDDYLYYRLSKTRRRFVDLIRAGYLGNVTVVAPPAGFEPAITCLEGRIPSSRTRAEESTKNGDGERTEDRAEQSGQKAVDCKVTDRRP